MNSVSSVQVVQSHSSASMVYKKATASAHSRTRSTPEESLAQPTMLLSLTMLHPEPASKNSAKGFAL